MAINLNYGHVGLWICAHHRCLELLLTFKGHLDLVGSGDDVSVRNYVASRVNYEARPEPLLAVPLRSSLGPEELAEKLIAKEFPKRMILEERIQIRRSLPG